MSAPIKLISTDFDGTLHCDWEQPAVPEKLEKLLFDLQRQGANWVINTGRDLPSLLHTLEEADLSVRPNFVAVVEREIYQLREHEYIAVDEWNRACSKDHDELFRRVQRDVPALADWVSARFKAQVYEDSYSPFCLIAESVPDADAIQSHLEKYCAKVPNLSVVRNHVYARFSHVAYNKGTALQEIARRIGVKPSQTVAAGDHYNDLPMLRREFAEKLIAPSNSIPEVKAHVKAQGGFVSELRWGHGVADGLEQYLNRDRAESSKLK